MLGNLILNGADIVLLIVLALFAFWGWRSGFLKMGFGLLSFLIAIVLGRILYPYCSGFLRGTPIYQTLLTMAEKHAVPTAESGGLMGDLIAKSGEVVSAYLADLALNVIAFLLVVVAVKLLLMFISRLLKLFASLPVIGLVNRLAGLALGILEGFLIAAVILAAIYVIAPLRENSAISREIEKSVVVRQWYLDNPLLNWTLPNEEKIERK